MKALAEQSIIGSPGRLGQATGRTSQTIEYVLTYKGRFNKPEEYENVAIKANSDGQILHLKDVADIELGARFFDIYSDINGYPSAAIVLKQSPGSNAAEVIAEVKRQLEQIKLETFPPGMEFEVTYDVSKFLEASIEKVLHTLVEAFVLVSLVEYLFLGDIRSTLIPTIAVPVSLIGTFFVMKMFGLSINLITLFAMVLAIGVELTRQSWLSIQKFGFQFWTTDTWDPVAGQFGALPFIWGTLYSSLLALAIAPLGEQPRLQITAAARRGGHLSDPLHRLEGAQRPPPWARPGPRLEPFGEGLPAARRGRQRGRAADLRDGG